jgi:hypothetical protein
MHGIRSLARISTGCTLALLASVPARAQCLEWKSGFHLPGVDGTPRAWATFDDGTGAALYVAGEFLNAGDVAARHIARWDGSSWTALGSGTDALVMALAVFDDGSGAALYAGGAFTFAGGVLRSGHRQVGTAPPGPRSNASHPLMFPDVQVLAGPRRGRRTGALRRRELQRPRSSRGERRRPLGTVPPGPRSAAASRPRDPGPGDRGLRRRSWTRALPWRKLRPIGGVTAHGLAKWDGSAWSGLGGVLAGNVGALATYDDGSGTALYVGGDFTTVAGAPAGGSRAGTAAPGRRSARISSRPTGRRASGRSRASTTGEVPRSTSAAGSNRRAA